MKRTLLFIFIFGLGLGAFAQAPKYSNEFLSIGVGARSLGMANAQTGITNDVNAAYWNPAGLANQSSDMQIGLMHNEYFAGIAKYDYGGFSMKLDTAATIGISVIRMGIDDIPNTINLYDNQGNINYDRITTFSAADYAFMFSYARKSRIKGLTYGGNVKLIYRQIGSFARAYGFGLDIGVQYTKDKWMFGAMARDITSTFNAWTFDVSDDMREVFEATGNEIPENSLEVTLPRLNLGAGRSFRISDSFTSLLAADLDFTFDGKRNTLIKSNPISIDPKLGVEFSFKDIVFVRGGIRNIQEETDFGDQKSITVEPNFGVGVRIKKMISIDYALTNIGDSYLYSNVFSLRIDLNRK
ncbi:MAG: PorV/PorQ family protein [Bacteroidota bacterium]